MLCLVHRKHDKALLFVFVVDFFDGRHFGFAGRAPGCPHVDEDSVALKIREGVAFAFRGFECEIGSGKSGLGGGVIGCDWTGLRGDGDPRGSGNQSEDVENDALGFIHGIWM